ncbi:MAG: thioredoxin domain-containing protein, partial [Candidatus Limnocylindria bacterium]
TAHTPAFAEDYAHVADGLLEAYAALGDASHLELAAALMDRAVADFWDEASGVFFDTSEEHDRTVARPRSLIDGATPAANSVAADVLLRLALLSGEPDHDRRARSILRAAGPALDRHPAQFGRMLAAADRALAEPIDAVIAGDPHDPRAIALRRAAAGPYQPDLVIAPLAPGERIAAWSLFEGKGARDGSPTAYVCRGYACDEPTSDPERVRAQVAALS